MQHFAGEGDSLGVVSSGNRGDAAGALLRTQLSDAVVCSADLEAASALKRFQLQEDPGPGDPAEVLGAVERGVMYDAANSLRRRSDFPQGNHSFPPG